MSDTVTDRAALDALDALDGLERMHDGFAADARCGLPPIPAELTLMREAIDTIRAALARPAEPAEGWRPIATAPTDCRERFFVGAIGHRIEIAYGRGTEDLSAWASHWKRRHGFTPTLWHALPAAPGEQRPEEGRE